VARTALPALPAKSQWRWFRCCGGAPFPGRLAIERTAPLLRNVPYSFDSAVSAKERHRPTVDGSEHLPLGGLVDDHLRDASTAIRQEVDASVDSGDIIELADGRLVGSVGADRVWSFVVDADIAPAPETPGQLRVGTGEPTSIQVLAVGDDSLVLSTSSDLGEHVDSAQLTLDAAFVYRRLLERLDDLIGTSAGDGGLFDQLVVPDPFESGEDAGGPGLDRPDPDEDQRRAVSKAAEPGLRFTWGPPGTGKTKVLAMAAAEAAQRGDRVLVLAHANAAVDVAIGRIADELADDPLVEEGRVLRVGTPQSAAVLSRNEILPDLLAEARRPESAGRLTELDEQRRALSNQMRSEFDPVRRSDLADELDAVRTETRELRRELKGVSADIVDEAAVVATTLSRAVIDDQLWLADWDVVIVDEASMAPLPFILAFALGDATTLSIFGDFRQLPPICVSFEEAAQRWFARDVFDFGGVIEAHEVGLVDPRLSVLRTQFRMGEQICETVNQFAYGGLLRTHLGARDRAIRLAELEPSAGAEIVIVDTSTLGSAALTDAQQDSYSRVSPLTAMLAASFAESLAAEGCESVGLISPYRAQTQWTHALVSHLSGVDAATIHRFQGSERDAIIFDLTDGPDFRSPSRLTGGDADQALRLFNVAVSRARGKLVALADLDFVERHFPLGSPFTKLVEAMLASGAEVVPAMHLVPDDLDADRESSVHWTTDWVGAVSAAIAASGPDATLDLNVPDGHVAPEQLVQLVGSTTASVRVRCSATTARQIEHTSAELRLLLTGPMPWAVVDESVLVLGARDPGGAAAMASGRRAVTAFRRAIAP
jgi:hypothetical protein